MEGFSYSGGVYSAQDMPEKFCGWGWLHVLNEIVIPLQIGTMPHRTRGLLASSFRGGREHFDRYYNNLLVQIKQHTISTNELYRQELFNIFSLLKCHDQKLQILDEEAAYPQHQPNGFFKKTTQIQAGFSVEINAYCTPAELHELGFEGALERTVERWSLIHAGCL